MKILFVNTKRIYKNMKLLTTLYIFFIIFITIAQPPCPNNITGNNANTNNITIYVYNSNNQIIDSIICNQAGNGSMNCNLSNLSSNAEYLSFGNINNGDDLGACIYDTNGINISGGLPIELGNFDVIYKDGVNVVNWNTYSERNNNYFTIEYSYDGYNWQSIQIINGAGNSSTELKYIHKHYTFKQNNINYYRLKQTDYDGVYERFYIVSVDNRKSKYIVKVVNTLGQEVNINTIGFIIVYFSDGSIIKKYN
jgi:hypothetical protein